MNFITTILFEHMNIGMIFYTHSTALTIDEIDTIAKRMSISNISLNLAITDLISHGIISSCFKDDHQLRYCITEFGQYFFKKFCSANEDVAELCEKVGDKKA